MDIEELGGKVFDPAAYSWELICLLEYMQTHTHIHKEDIFSESYTTFSILPLSKFNIIF